MELKTRTQLEEAKAYFYAWRLVEAYNIFRRFFDRLPFKPEKEHAEYIGMFVRTLVELGKEYELKFYVTELERWHDKVRMPEVAYSLAMTYRFLDPPKWEASHALFESVAKDPSAKSLHGKAKMMLANYYSVKGDLAACHAIIHSIQTEDPSLLALVDIWKAYVARMEGRFEQSRALLETLLETLSPQKDWYAFFSAKVILSLTLLDLKKTAEVRATILEIKNLFAGRHFKSVQHQLKELEEMLQKEETLGSVYFTPGLNESRFSYRDKTLAIKNKDPRDRLLVLLLKKRFLEKSMIVKALYQRPYQGEVDDKLIYYHIHALRKRLKTIGLSGEAICNEGSGYRWVPDVEILEGDI